MPGNESRAKRVSGVDGIDLHSLAHDNCILVTERHLALRDVQETIILKTEMALDSARVRSGSVSFSIRVESFSGIDSSR